VRPEDLAGADAMDVAFLDYRRAGGNCEQPPFPHPTVVGSMYEGVVGHFGDEVLRGRKRGGSFKHHNLIPACVAWYVGKRGELIENTKLRDEVVCALDMHLFAPLGKKTLGSKSSNVATQLWTAVNNVSRSQLIQRTDEELRDPHIWTRFSFNLSG
jgi:hypothetical protein